MRILLIVTSHDQLGDTGQATGFWLEEVAVPYYEFLEQGYDLDIASIKGGEAPIDPRSLESDSPVCKRFVEDMTARGKARNTLKIEDLLYLGASYDAYWVAGGHGIVWDGPDNPALQQLLGRAYDEGKLIAAVCHGPAALVNVRLKDGQLLVKGRRVNSYTDEEERAAKLDSVVPFLLESRLRQLGALFEKAPPNQACVVVDERLLTGQNPVSAAPLVRKAIELLAPELTTIAGGMSGQSSSPQIAENI